VPFVLISIGCSVCNLSQAFGQATGAVVILSAYDPVGHSTVYSTKPFAVGKDLRMAFYAARKGRSGPLGPSVVITILSTAPLAQFGPRASMALITNSRDTIPLGTGELDSAPPEGLKAVMYVQIKTNDFLVMAGAAAWTFVLGDSSTVLSRDEMVGINSYRDRLLK